MPNHTKKPTPNTIEDRFWSKVNRRAPDECWEWTGTKLHGQGYGRAIINKRDLLAHRVSYELAFGEIPKDMCVLHRCDNPACVNPRHLFLGTRVENNTDKMLKGRASRLFGNRNPNRKLTEDLVRDIRHRYANGETQVNLAESFGVGQSVISSIVRRETWRHVK